MKLNEVKYRSTFICVNHNISKKLISKKLTIPHQLLIFVATLNVDTHTREEHVELITDRNKSTCLAVPHERPVQLVAELTIRTQIENATLDDVIIEIQLSSLDNCERIVVFNTTTNNNCTSVKKVQGVMGEMIPGVTGNNFCYYKLPVSCGSSFCEIHGHLAVRNDASRDADILICEMQQG